jgi:exopolysaccharide biosynthesis polyprenyl glycosylphosphotransferase
MGCGERGAGILGRGLRMVRHRNKIRNLALYAGDLLSTVLAFLLAYVFRGAFPDESFPYLFPLSWHLTLLWSILPLWVLIFFMMGLYQYWKGPGFWRETWMIFKAVFLSCLIVGSIIFALKFQFVSRIFFLSFALLDVVLVILFRFLLRKGIHLVGRHSEGFRFILIVGLDRQALEMARGIERHRDLGLRVRGFLSPGDAGFPAKLDGYAVLGSAQDLPQILEREIIDEVIFAVSQEELRQMDKLMLFCEEQGITTRVILDFFPHLISRTYIEDLDGFPLLTFSTTPKSELLLFYRRILDFMGSLVLISLLSPLFLLITVLIRLDSPGPALFRQVRCGVNGRRFTFYKFRSMEVGAEEKKKGLLHLNLMSGPVFKIKNDPRVTRVGHFLRKTSLDELPQLFNVLRGSMSFVGPRPLPAEEVEKIKGWQRRRLSMKPGITGLWQVSGRNHVDFQDWVKLDLEYIDNWSLWLDLKILLKTIPAVLSGKGAM